MSSINIRKKLEIVKEYKKYRVHFYHAPLLRTLRARSHEDLKQVRSPWALWWGKQSIHTIYLFFLIAFTC